MKNLIIFIIFNFLIINYAHSDSHTTEIIDCTQFEKLKAKLDCKAKNLRTRLNKGQSKIKEKIENPGETETGKKFKKSKLGKALEKFKNPGKSSDYE